MVCARLLVLAVCLGIGNAYPSFQAKLPNVGSSSRIPAPMSIANAVGQTCQSIGHVAQCGGSPSGGGNPFGRAFLAAGRTYTRALCMADSDGDGIINGVELGDPQCLWSEGSNVALQTTGLSHPGFSCSTPQNPYCMTGSPATTRKGATPPPTTPAATTPAGNQQSTGTDSGSKPSWEVALVFAILISLVKTSLIYINEHLTAKRAHQQQQGGSFSRKDSQVNLKSESQQGVINVAYEGEKEDQA